MDDNFIIECYFDNLHSRINFLEKLAKQEIETKHSDGLITTTSATQEALLLCLCYIDGCGNLYYGKSRGSKKNFIDILIELGGKPIFGAIHPKMLIRYFETSLTRKANNKLKNLFTKIKPLLEYLLNENKGNFLSQNEFEKILNTQKIFSLKEFDHLQGLLCYGTYAAIGYDEMRCPSVHNLGTCDVSFGESTFNNQPVETLSFPIYLDALREIIKKIQALEAAKLFELFRTNL